MRCLACETEKQPGSWLCPNCGTPIPKPSKPPYKAAGWEWIGAIVFLVLAESLPCVDPTPSDVALKGLIFWWFSVALAFSAARDKRRGQRVAGWLCLAFWVFLMVWNMWDLWPQLLVGGYKVWDIWPLLFLAGYMVFILTLEYVLWWIKVARM